MRYLILTILLAGCTGPTTVCGQWVDPIDGGEWLTLADVQTAEDRILTTVSLLLEGRMNDPTATCTRLNGNRIVARGDPFWVDNWGRQVHGLAFCGGPVIPDKHIMIAAPNSAKGDWTGSSLVHETMHILQGCRTSADLGGDLYDDHGFHANWGHDGIYSAINTINNGVW